MAVSGKNMIMGAAGGALVGYLLQIRAVQITLLILMAIGGILYFWDGVSEYEIDHKVDTALYEPAPGTQDVAWEIKTVDKIFSNNYQLSGTVHNQTDDTVQSFVVQFTMLECPAFYSPEEECRRLKTGRDKVVGDIRPGHVRHFKVMAPFPGAHPKLPDVRVSAVIRHIKLDSDAN